MATTPYIGDKVLDSLTKKRDSLASGLSSASINYSSSPSKKELSSDAQLKAINDQIRAQQGKKI